MPSKTEEYLALAQRTANGLTRYWESWTDYLTTASRLYKYPFADQLMIYAQRPDATACADYDVWNSRMNRYVRRGAKGIALLDESGGFPRLHYVFDVSDTGVRRNSRDPEVWQLGPDLVQPVSEMLSKTYGISGERVSQQLADVAGKLVADYWDNNGGDIRAIVDGSLLMDYDDAGVEMQFKSAAAISVTYTLLERCGFEPAGWFDKDDFQATYNFSTPDSVYALGAAVSDMSREVLRQIERTVKTTIRRRNAERSQYEYEQQERDLLDRRGLPAPEPDSEPAPEAAGQVRQAAPDVPEGASPGAVPHDAPERESVPAPDGGGADGREPDAADHGATSETEPGPGQGTESDGMGAAHEQPESADRGTGADGADLQLSFFDAAIPTEAQQIEKIDQVESKKTPSAFVLSQAEIENELRKHGSGFMGGKQRIMALYQTQPDRSLRAKTLAKEYGIGGHSHDYLDGSRGFVNHDGRGMEFDHYPEHKKFALSWTQVEKYIDLMIQSDRYLTDKEKEHYTPPVNAEPDADLTRAKNLIREFCLEEYDSEPDFSDLSKIGVAYTNATDEEIPIQVNVDLVGYRVERYLGEVLIDERQYESLEDLTETELEALDFSELVSVTDEELEHYHSKAEERPALLPLDAATEYNTLKEQHPDALVGFEQGGQFEFYGEDARKVCELVGGKLLEKETELGTVPVTGFPSDQWVYRAKQLWQCGENIYLAGLNEDGTHHQTKYLRREDYLPLGATIHMEGRAFRVDTVNFDKGSVSLQDVALAKMRMPVFREEPLALVRELYEEQDMMESPLPDYKVGDNVVVELPTRTIEGKVGYVGETDVRIDTSAHGQSWDNEVVNQNETTLAQQKQQAIKDAFADWVWKDPQRRALLVKKYNELFNSTRPREYDGSHIHFVGMNPEINLREHQRNAVAHVLYGYNTLLAHEVGAGKSFEMAASAMELKRLGLCQKSLFVVPNHLTEQWASEFLRLYPNAKLLVTSKKDFEPANRKKFCARIATGDYDAVIIGHSQFEKIPLSAERQERLIQEQMDEIEEAIEEAKAQVGEHFTVKQLEKLRKSLKQKLEKLQGADRKDDVVTFEQLGVDRLFVDESQNYKNLFLYTKMRNVAGLSTSEAQKSSDMFGKCRYLDEITGGRGVIFATGTPLSNSMTEMYTLMRYLQYNTLQQKGLTHFDAWASTFGETTTAIELAPEGTGYRARTRFAKFFNLPELMAMFKEAADIKTSDQLHLPVPDAKFETVVVKPSEIQQDMVQALSERAAEVHSGSVDPSVDNMLKITSDGRKIGLDQRLMNSALPDDPNSKLNACVNNVLRIWNDTKEQKLTQLIFCDMSTPKGDGSFNVYDDIRTKLLNAGVPEQEIEFIHNADTENKKAELFSKVRSGQVRVLLGSTAKMGAGTNVQTLLVAVHHLDVGWRPSDMTQRNGRIIRQGNQNKQVYVYNYVTESTFDAYLYQTLENKQKFISQIMTSKSPMRSCDDIDEQALSYAEIKALCAGDPRIREKMDLDVQVAKLKVLRGDFQNQKYRLEDKLLKTFPEEIQKQKTRIAALQQDSQIAAAHPQDKENFCGMTIKGMVYDDKKSAGERLLLARQEMPNADMMLLGTYRGFELNIRFDSFKNEHQAVLRAELSYPVSLGDDARGNITRLDNAIDNFTDRIADAENALQNLEQQKQAAEVEVAKPFAQEEELAEKSARLSELNALLNIDRSSAQDSPEKAEETPTTRPSVLAALEEKTNQSEPVKPFRSYYDKDGDAR